MASYLTAFTFSGAVIVNIFFVLAILVEAVGREHVDLLMPAWGGPVVIAVLFVTNYAVFLRAERYALLRTRFLTYPPAKRRRISVVAWIYLFSSYLIPAGLAFLMSLGTPD